MSLFWKRRRYIDRRRNFKIWKRTLYRYGAKRGIRVGF